MPAIARGRLLLFDRVGNQARLRCLQSETGESLWTFAYETAYEDLYGYSNGPRCAPVVDGNRVFIFGPAGMLHCLRLFDGQLLWKVDAQDQFAVVQNFFGVGSTPVVHGDLLIVQPFCLDNSAKSVEMVREWWHSISEPGKSSIRYRMNWRVTHHPCWPKQQIATGALSLPVAD